MKKKFYSFVSMFLVICMVMSSIPVYAITEPESKLDTPETNVENKETITNPEFNAAGSSKVLDYVDKAEFESHKFIGRVLEEEELNSYVFQNEDGSRTAYFFSENVKYVDKDGIVQEKDISLVATRDGYTTTKNEVSVNFSSSPSNGISMGYGGHTVTLKPIFTTKGVTASKKDNAVEYVGLFDSNTTLKYTPLLSGIKEDIVLTKYTGENEYSFTLTTNGLGIFESENGYFLAESEATKAIFYLGDIIAYDANYVPYEGTLTVKTIKENQEYTLIVSVDEAFLTDKNTVYPVTIDPTITISDTASGAGAIQDAPIFSARPSSNHGTYEYDRVGTPSADFGVGRTVVRLYGLINSSIYKNTKLTDITSVKFFAKEATGSATQYINLYPLQNTGWTESGVTWNNIGVCYNTSNYGASMAYAQLTEFDITNLVIAWKTGTYSANAGFIMMSSNESANKCFVSSEHTDTSRRPYVVMAYEKSIDFDNAITLQLDVFKTTTISQSGEVKCYKFIPTETGFYTFQSSSSSGDPKGWLYNTLEQEITSNDDISSSNRNFRITYHLVSGKTYYFLAGYYLSGTGSYNIQLRRTDNDSYLKTTTISFGSTPEVYNISLESQIYKFTPTVSGLYVFYSNGNSDPKAWIYDSDLSCMGYNDDSAGNSSFRLAYNLTAENTYYIVAGQYGSENGNYSFSCARELILDGENFRIENSSSGFFIDVQNLNNGEQIRQSQLNLDTNQQWQLIRQSDGYYAIKSKRSSYYLGISSTSVGADNVSLIQQVNDYSKWKIFITEEGKCFIESKVVIGRVLNVPTTTQDDLLQLRYLGNSNLSGGLWNIMTKTFVLYSVTDISGGHYHTEQIHEVKNKLNNFSGYLPITKIANLSPTVCRSDLQNCDVFISRSHGNYESSILGSVSRTYIDLDSGKLYSHSPLSMGEGNDSLNSSDDYSGLGIALFVACYTGIGGEGGNNLPTAIVEYGAETAVGFTESINCSAAGEWTNTFVDWLLAGYSAKVAFEYAEEASGLDCGILCGNDNFILDN